MYIVIPVNKLKTKNMMKKQIILTPKELINSEYRKFIITIELSDDYKNGHDDFSITANGWSKYNKSSEQDCGGCLHEDILKLKPELKIFVDLHLSDYNGAPMYTVENDYYWLHKDKQRAIEYLRITEVEYNLLYNAKDKIEYSNLLHSLGIVKRWKSEADYAIKTLEKMTGEKYINTSVKSHFE